MTGMNNLGISQKGCVLQSEPNNRAKDSRTIQDQKSGLVRAALFWVSFYNLLDGIMSKRKGMLETVM